MNEPEVDYDCKKCNTKHHPEDACEPVLKKQIRAILWDKITPGGVSSINGIPSAADAIYDLFQDELLKSRTEPKL